MTAPQGVATLPVPRAKLMVDSSLPKDADAKGANLYDVKPPEEVPIRSWRLLYVLAGVLALLGLGLRAGEVPLEAQAPDAGVRAAARAAARARHQGARRARRREPARAEASSSRTTSGSRRSSAATWASSTTSRRSRAPRRSCSTALRSRTTPGLPMPELVTFAEGSDFIRYAQASCPRWTSARRTSSWRTASSTPRRRPAPARAPRRDRSLELPEPAGPLAVGAGAGVPGLGLGGEEEARGAALLGGQPALQAGPRLQALRVVDAAGAAQSPPSCGGDRPGPAAGARQPGEGSLGRGHRHHDRPRPLHVDGGGGLPAQQPADTWPRRCSPSSSRAARTIASAWWCSRAPPTPRPRSRSTTGCSRRSSSSCAPGCWKTAPPSATRWPRRSTGCATLKRRAGWWCSSPTATTTRAGSRRSTPRRPRRR